MKKSGTVEALKKVSKGLLYRSETDAPFEPIEWAGEQGKPDKARVLELAGLPASTPVKTKGLDAFFKDMTREQDWMDEEEKAEVEKFRQLVEAIKDNLADVKVFLAGRAEADAYIVGRSEAGWAGLKTKVVQTCIHPDVPGRS
jgi:histidine triad (HIT) family protein